MAEKRLAILVDPSKVANTYEALRFFLGGAMAYSGVIDYHEAGSDEEMAKVLHQWGNKYIEVYQDRLLAIILCRGDQPWELKMRLIWYRDWRHLWSPVGAL